MSKPFHRMPMNVELADSAAEAAAKQHTATLQLEGVSNHHTTWKPTFSHGHLDAQVELVDSAAEAAATEHTATLQLEGVGDLTVGIARARGSKCSRCWNYSEQVGGSLQFLQCSSAGSARAHGAKGIQVHPLLGLQQIGVHVGDVIM